MLGSHLVLVTLYHGLQLELAMLNIISIVHSSTCKDEIESPLRYLISLSIPKA